MSKSAIAGRILKVIGFIIISPIIIFFMIMFWLDSDSPEEKERKKDIQENMDWEKREREFKEDEEDKEILYQQILTAKRKAKRDEAIAEWQNQEAS
jgi:large-conductance mechanosensitive channel